MRRKYFTQKGSVYIQTVNGQGEYWRKEGDGGQLFPLSAGIHISQQKLRELLSEYPASLLDKTYCFDADVEREFFEDARRERHTGPLSGEPTVIFFLIKRDGGRYGIGCSSPVVKVEETEA